MENTTDTKIKNDNVN